MSGPSVRWRYGGHRLRPDSDVLRFEVADINRVIINAVANADLYRDIQIRQSHPEDWQVLVLSCFAVTPEWPPVSLAEQTGFRQYRLAPARVINDAGYELWPTEVFVDDTPDPRNEVHYDLVVAAGPGLIAPALITGTKAERRTARATLAPRFERLLDVLGEPLELR